jgi:hypothetical protein
MVDDDLDMFVFMHVTITTYNGRVTSCEDDVLVKAKWFQTLQWFDERYLLVRRR